jgi:phosphomevalonate kinase
MKAKAPGKVVISGAYAVLHGAPALVSAVDRYAIADTSLPADFVTPEVRAGLRADFPCVDASELRDEGRKLGLGSSAAILVASLVAAEYPDLVPGSPAAHEVFERCLRAHRQAQGGGSGIDVAASVFGGTLEYQLPSSGPALPKVTARRLPELCFQLWAADRAASTAEFLARIAAFRAHAPLHHDRLMSRLISASSATRDACVAGAAPAFLQGVAGQAEGLLELGTAAGIPIYIPELVELSRCAAEEGAVVLPAGAGGGDIALFVGLVRPSDALLSRCEALHHRPLRVTFGASGAQTLTTST